MRQINDLMIAADQQITWKPSGMYLMMRISAATCLGENVAMTIKLGNGTQQSTVMTVKK